MKRDLIIQIIAALLILLFIYAALNKLMNYQLFVAQLHTHQYLKHFAGLIAWTVPTVEILVSLLLIFSATRIAGLYASAGLLLIFTIYLLLMLLSGKDLPCSCGGIINGFSWKQHVVFNLIFTGFAVIGIALNKNENKPITTLKESVFT